MRRVLIISYDFPPASLGIWRTLKFCKYMSEFGWKPAILTVKPIRSPRWDEGPLAELPPGTPIRRTESLDQNRLAWLAAQCKRRLRGGGRQSTLPAAHANPRPTHALFRTVMDRFREWLLIPDDRAGWYPFAVREGLRWARSEQFDVVYTTCFPHTAHLVGERIARATGLPMVADFRDIWIGNYYYYHPATPWHDRLQRRLERRVVERARSVISATGPITDDFLARYPDQPREKFVTITNGFDPPDYPEVTPRIDTEHFTISYVGTMFGSTSPAAFFRAVRMLLHKEPRWRDKLRLRFVGTMIEPFKAMIDRHGLGGITTLDPYLPHDQALRVMAEADLLLLIVSPATGSHIMLTQKVFEYAAARRPILGIVPDGAARDFLEELNEGPMHYPDDVRGMAWSIRRMLENWQNRGRPTLGANPVLAQYERRNLAGRLCAQLDQAVSIR